MKLPLELRSTQNAQDQIVAIREPFVFVDELRPPHTAARPRPRDIRQAIYSVHLNCGAFKSELLAAKCLSEGMGVTLDRFFGLPN